MPIGFLRISTQVAHALRDEITANTWVDVLPAELQLATRYQVSRKTIRAALTELRSVGLIETKNGVGSTVVRHKTKAPSSTVRYRLGLLTPHPVDAVRQYTVLWIDYLREALQNAGYQLEVICDRRCFGATASRSLQKLTRSNPVACWILISSNRAIQSWFHQARIPVVVAGSAYPGIGLPCVDVDHHALCYHAAGTLLRYGHRNIALFFEKAGHAGDVESEAGFMVACAAVTPERVYFQIVKIDRDPASIIRQIKRLLAIAAPPTAFLLSNSSSYLTAASYLNSLAKRIPDDVSLISRDDEPFLEHLYPVPARYSCSPRKFAGAMYHALDEVIRKWKDCPKQVRIMPDFLPGGSVGPAPPL